MNKKKKTLTLLEIILVIFLITLITGAIGYNMKGTLDRGKAFRTEQARAELHDLLLVAVSEGRSFSDVLQNKEKYIRDAGLAKNPDKLFEDGWGNKFSIALNKDKDDFVIESDALTKYYKKIGKS